MPPKDAGKGAAAEKGGKKKAEEEAAAAKAAAAKKAKEAPPPPSPQEVLHRNLAFVDKYVDSRDRLYLVRALRYTGFVRERCPLSVVRKAVETYVPDAGRKSQLLDSLSAVAAARAAKTSGVVSDGDAAMDAGAAAGSSAPAAAAPATATAAGVANGATPSSSSPSPAPSTAAAAKLPKPGGPAALELEAYLHLLVLTMVSSALPKDPRAAGEAAKALLDSLAAHNRRTLDFFQAKAWAALALAHERLPASGGLPALQPALITAYRTACLRHDEYGQAVLLNLLLRAALDAKDVETAAALVARTEFPEAASPAQFVRFLFYTGRIKAVQLQYSDSYNSLMQALRKAPPSAVGFRTLAQKFALVVQLLMGEIPERALFATPEMRAALRPYLALTRAVRLGDLPAFSAAVSSGSSVFSADGTLTLVRRLEATVVKAGLRKIATSYARISFADIARKLGLGSPEDAEFLAAKAIRDGVLDGVLDHAAGTLESRGAPNVYGGKEPQEAFHRRITFCLDVHAEAVRAMRYPPSAARADLESAEAKAEREREEEFINELAEGKDLDDDDDED